MRTLGATSIFAKGKNVNRSRSPAPEIPERALPFRGFLCQENRDRTHSSGTCQWQVPSPCAHTGGNLYFCQRQKCKSIPVTGTMSEQSPLCSDIFLCLWQKRRHPPAPLLSFPNRTRCAGLRFGFGRKSGGVGIYTVVMFQKSSEGQHPSGDFYAQKTGSEPIAAEPARAGSVSSRHTGDSLYFCQRQKCKSIPARPVTLPGGFPFPASAAILSAKGPRHSR